MFASRAGKDDEDENQQRLQSFSIPQQPSWTGLKKQTRANDKGTQHRRPLEIHLILWNILGFAVGDPHDYKSFAVVNKDWNVMTKKLVPPVVFRMKHCLSSQSPLKEENMDLLTEVFHMLKSKDCPLYIQDENVADEQTSSTVSTWPHLQPQFLLLLIRYVYTGATQGSPNNQSKQTYQIVCNFLDVLAKQTAQNMIKSLDDFAHDTNKASACFQSLTSQWVAWEGTCRIVDSIVQYLNRYFTRHHNLKATSDHASASLVNCLAYGIEKKHFDSMQILMKGMHSNICSSPQMAPGIVPRDLLSQSYHCMEKIRSLPFVEGRWREALPAVAEMNELISEIQNAMDQTPGKSQETPISLETGVTFIFPDKRKRQVSVHFVESSGLLKQLHLSNGAVLYWDEALTSAFDKVVEFYRMDEETPIPAVEAPLRSHRMEDLIGEEAGHFINAVEREVLFEMLTLCSFLNFKKLQDICAGQVSNMIRGCSAQELRQIFNISDT